MIGQHQRQQRDRVGRVAQRQHDGEGADKRHRHRDDRDQGGAQVAEEDEDDDRHEDEGLDQRVDHALDRGFHEDRRVVHHVVGDILGEARLQRLDRIAHALGRGQRIGAGQLVDLDAGRGLAVVAAELVAGLGAQLDPGDVLDPDQRESWSGGRRQDGGQKDQRDGFE